MPGAGSTVHACARILAASDQGCPPWLPAQLDGMKNEPQLRPSILVHEWKFGNLADDKAVVCIPTLSYPVLCGDIKNLYVPHPSLETTTASFSSSDSLDLSQPFVRSRDSYFSRDHSGLVFFILM